MDDAARREALESRRQRGHGQVLGCWHYQSRRYQTTYEGIMYPSAQRCSRSWKDASTAGCGRRSKLVSSTPSRSPPCERPSKLQAVGSSSARGSPQKRPGASTIVLVVSLSPFLSAAAGLPACPVSCDDRIGAYLGRPHRARARGRFLAAQSRRRRGK
ncbi:hypothetical protein ZWY2020_008669 [Hordeum vulgare]|nr:hypothetical protein ZWY2020_008669 [Hordeum vulgare]